MRTTKQSWEWWLKLPMYSLEDTGKYANLKMEEFVGGKKKRSA